MPSGGGELVAVDRRSVGWVRGIATKGEDVPVEVWLRKVIVVLRFS